MLENKAVCLVNILYNLNRPNSEKKCWSLDYSINTLCKDTHNVSEHFALILLVTPCQ